MLIAGNWKMNTTTDSAVELAQGVVDAVGTNDTVQMAVCPPFVQLASVAKALEGSNVKLGAQNMHFLDSGAYTGEVAAPMLTAVGCSHVILGHSERRQYFQETDVLVNKKICQAMAHGLIPIVCIGETLDERESGRAEDVVRTQLEGALSELTISDPDRIVFAYEPVWAIGTGVTATPEQAQSMHAFVRGLIAERFGEAFGRSVQLLYGGSMKPANAADLLARPDIDGGLIGGASLKADSFSELIDIATETVT